MRKILMIPALLLVLAGCGGDDPAPAEAEVPATTAPSTTLVSLSVETDSGLVAINHDDELCVFSEPEYELRNGAGEIIDVGRFEEEGVSVGPSEWAAVGSVESLDPYRCVLHETVTVPAADIYTLTVTVKEAPLLPGDPDELAVSGEATFRRDGADDVTVEIQENR